MLSIIVHDVADIIAIGAWVRPVALPVQRGQKRDAFGYGSEAFCPERALTNMAIPGRKVADRLAPTMHNRGAGRDLRRAVSGTDRRVAFPWAYQSIKNDSKGAKAFSKRMASSAGSENAGKDKWGMIQFSLIGSCSNRAGTACPTLVSRWRSLVHDNQNQQAPADKPHSAASQR